MAGRSQLPVQIMENQTRFDLNAAVENWRNELAAQPNLASDDRRELETHLRDAIAGFQQRGLNDEESFWLARKRVGQPLQLGEEFVKADPAKAWRERIVWMSIGLLLLHVWSSATFFVGVMFPDYFFRGDVNSMLFYQTIVFGPIIWIAISLALGRIKKISVFGSLLFRSRLHFVVITTAAVALLLGFDWLQQYIQTSRAFQQFPNMPRQILLQPEWRLFAKEIGPCICIALITWLMPTQNRKTPKRA